jgi:hypothetical protein
MIEWFDRSSKPTFKDEQTKSFIKFGSIRDQDPQFGIRSGQLVLSGYVPAGRVKNCTMLECIANDSTRSVVSQFFSPSISRIIAAIHRQQLACSKTISVSICCTSIITVILINFLSVLQTVFLVGGYASSPWLYTQLQKALDPSGISVCRPDGHTYVDGSSQLALSKYMLLTGIKPWQRELPHSTFCTLSPDG